MPFGLGAPELIIILVIIMVIFGGTQLPKLARSLGQAKNEFEKSAAESEKIKKTSATEKEGTASGAASTQGELVQSTGAVTNTRTGAGAATRDEQVTMSKADLDALIKKAAENQQNSGGPTKA